MPVRKQLPVYLTRRSKDDKTVYDFICKSRPVSTLIDALYTLELNGKTLNNIDDTSRLYLCFEGSTKHISLTKVLKRANFVPTEEFFDLSSLV